LIKSLLEGIAKGASFVDLKKNHMFDNEILLYLHPRRIFSIRFILYEALQYTSIHDHSSWGVSGNANGELEVVGFKRIDDRSQEGRATLTKTKNRRLRPGQIEGTLPLDAGIHQTGNPGDGTVVMVSVYGSPVRRLFINDYDFDKGQVRRLYPPRLNKKRLAAAALDCIDWQ
jgi:predicted metal-dependent enzyme (double-stranded beta helix superfamily)